MRIFVQQSGFTVKQSGFTVKQSGFTVNILKGFLLLYPASVRWALAIICRSPIVALGEPC
jgi:hypothetical protein